MAKMSGDSAKEITSLLAQSITSVDSLVSQTKSRITTLSSESRARMQKGGSMVQECGKALEDIIVNVQRMNDMSKEIIIASKEQDEGIKNIAIAMNELDHSIVANSQAATETTHNATEVSHHEALSRVAAQVSVTIEGGKVHSDDVYALSESQTTEDTHQSA